MTGALDARGINEVIGGAGADIVDRRRDDGAGILEGDGGSAVAASGVAEGETEIIVAGCREVHSVDLRAVTVGAIRDARASRSETGIGGAVRRRRTAAPANRLPSTIDPAG